MSAVISADYQGLAVSFGEDGWFNATEAARHFGKDVRKWLRLKSTEDYIKELCEIYDENLNVPNQAHLEPTGNTAFPNRADLPLFKTTAHKPGKSRFIKTRQGKHGGTWLHPKLAVPFARWLNTRFAIWCDMFIDRLLRGEHPHFDWKRMRGKAASSALILTDALNINRGMQGKETRPHHYMNEHRLVNWSVTGEFKGLDRDGLSEEELNLLAVAELYEAAQISRGLPWKVRKKGLRAYMETRRQAPRALEA